MASHPKGRRDKATMPRRSTWLLLILVAALTCSQPSLSLTPQGDYDGTEPNTGIPLSVAPSDEGTASHPASSRIFAILRNPSVLETMKRFLESYSVIMPASGSPVIVKGVAKPGVVDDIRHVPGVLKVAHDAPVESPPMIDAKTTAFESPYGIARSREVTQSDEAEMRFGVSGAGVKIAVVDTGVDYAVRDLRDSLILDEVGRPFILDADEQGLVYPFYAVRRKTSSVLDTSSLGTIVVWDGLKMTTVMIQRDYSIGGIVSRSGNFKFSVLVENVTSSVLYIPTLLADTTVASVYDVAYFDLTTAFANFQNALNGNFLQPDFSFADEQGVLLTPNTSPSKLVIAKDFTGDGVPDFSAGVAGTYFYDVHSLLGPSPQILSGVSSSGRYLAVLFDHAGHGTATASAAAGRGNTIYYEPFFEIFLPPLPGIAKKASIVGVNALWFGDVVEAWMWVSGFDVGFDRVWTYTGRHRVDIVSNSWGASWLLDEGLQPYAFGYDIISMIENALMLPGYLHPSFPGVVMVHAAGNGGPGYGTITSPATSSLAITVGSSTSFGPLQLLGWGEGRQDTIVSFNAAGPTTLGELKPDVVNVGAYDFAPAPVNQGLGNGSKAGQLFGGSSMAAPLTAGTAALMVEALRGAGRSWNPLNIKAMLMTSADDLGYEGIVQGAGRVNSLKAVTLALQGARAGLTPAFIATSDATWNSVAGSLAKPWSDFITNNFSRPFPTTPVFQTNWYAGKLQPGATAAATFTVQNPSLSSQIITLDTLSYSLTEYGELSLVLRRDGDVFILGPQVASSDLMTAVLTLQMKDFDNNHDGTPETVFYFTAYDWVDTNGDESLQPEELNWLDAAFNSATSNLMQIGLPAAHINGVLVFRVTQVVSLEEDTGNGYPVGDGLPFQIRYYSYVRAPWDAIRLDTQRIALPSGSSRTFTAQIPFSDQTAEPGAYNGFIRLRNTSGWTQLIPVLFHVKVEMSSANATSFGANQTSATPGLYENGWLHGVFNYGWRAEAGDWRIYSVDFTNQSMLSALVRVNWEDPDSLLNLYVYNASGVLVSYMDTYREELESGVYGYWTNTGNNTSNEAYVDLLANGYGEYTILIHNVLYGGAVFPEPFTVEILRLGSLAPVGGEGWLRGEAAFSVEPQPIRDTGSSSRLYYDWLPEGLDSQSDFLHIAPTTGRAIRKYVVSVDGVKTDITGNPSFKVDTQRLQDGPHQLAILTTYRDYSEPFSNSRTIYVDNTAPKVSIDFPRDWTRVEGSVTVFFSTSDPYLASATLIIDGVPFDVLGQTMFAWDATHVGIGSHTIQLQAKDLAGNSGQATVTVYVGVTPPTTPHVPSITPIYIVLLASPLFVAMLTGRSRRIRR